MGGLAGQRVCIVEEGLVVGATGKNISSCVGESCGVEIIW